MRGPCIKALLTYPYKPNCPFRGFYGEDKDLGVRYMVIEKLGCDLTSYANSSPTPPLIKTLLR